MTGSSIITSAAAALTLALFGGHALADTIDFGQFGPEGTYPLNPLTGVTTGGVDFTLVAPGTLYRDNEGSQFFGDLTAGTPTLFSQAQGGQLVIYFATPISSLGTLYVETNKYENYTATLNAYDSLGTLLGSVSYNHTETGTPGTDPGFEIFGAGIDHVTLFTSDPNTGFNVAGAYIATGGIPEPASWALMLIGFAGMGAVLRAGRRATAI